MNYSVNRKDKKAIYREGHHSFELLAEVNGCVVGCCTGISVYTTICPCESVLVSCSSYKYMNSW